MSDTQAKAGYEPKHAETRAGNGEQPLKIAFCFDLVRKDYLIYCLTTLVSLFENNKNNRLRVYIVSRDLGENGMREIKTLAARYGQELVFISELEASHLRLIEQLHAKCMTRRPERWGKLPPACFYRLFLPFLIPESRVLYLDIADIIVCDDLQQLYNTSFDNNLVCGVLDLRQDVVRRVDAETFDTEVVRAIRPDWRDEPWGYINSGVMLLNLEQFDLEKYLGQLVRASDFAFAHADQSLANIVFRGKTKVLDKKYNFFVHYRRKYIDHMMMRNQHILHYTGQCYQKYPSQAHTKYYYKLYYYYLDKTPYAGFRHAGHTPLTRLLKRLLPKRSTQKKQIG